jgi:hypothetical protein
MTDERQITEQSSDANQISTKRGFPVYRTNPSVPSAKGLPTRNKRFHVPGGKASVIAVTEPLLPSQSVRPAPRVVFGPGRHHRRDE